MAESIACQDLNYNQITQFQALECLKSQIVPDLESTVDMTRD